MGNGKGGHLCFTKSSKVCSLALGSGHREDLVLCVTGFFSRSCSEMLKSPSKDLNIIRVNGAGWVGVGRGHVMMRFEHCQGEWGRVGGCRWSFCIAQNLI